jgi:hypothetical protein
VLEQQPAFIVERAIERAAEQSVPDPDVFTRSLSEETRLNSQCRPRV